MEQPTRCRDAGIVAIFKRCPVVGAVAVDVAEGFHQGLPTVVRQFSVEITRGGQPRQGI